jgi:transcriptional regulator with XRE-family HTH domain
MSANSTTPEISVRERAIAAEVRAIMARRQVSGSELAREMGVDQTWLSRRTTGKVAFTAGELQQLMDILDEDIIRVFAAGAASLAAERKTNPCLSDRENVCSEHLGTWARRGLELGAKLYPGLFITDGADRTAA